MEISGPKATIQRARKLRKEMTKPERLLWWALRRKETNFHFRHQHPAGPYVLDFYCDAARLCVEVDGTSHDFRQANDLRRDAFLAKLGVLTLRVSARDVLTNLDGIVRVICEELHRRAPSAASRHLPRGGRS